MALRGLWARGRGSGRRAVSDDLRELPPAKISHGGEAEFVRWVRTGDGLAHSIIVAKVERSTERGWFVQWARPVEGVAHTLTRERTQDQNGSWMIFLPADDWAVIKP